MQMQCALGDIVHHLGHRRLDGRNILAYLQVILVLIDQPGGPQHQQPERFHLDPAVGDTFLGHLEFGDGAASGLPADDAFAHHVEGLAYLGHRAHGVMYTATTETRLCDSERTPSAPSMFSAGMRALVKRV